MDMSSQLIPFLLKLGKRSKEDAVLVAIIVKFEKWSKRGIRAVRGVFSSMHVVLLSYVYIWGFTCINSFITSTTTTTITHRVPLVVVVLVAIITTTLLTTITPLTDITTPLTITTGKSYSCYRFPPFWVSKGKEERTRGKGRGKGDGTDVEEKRKGEKSG